MKEAECGGGAADDWRAILRGKRRLSNHPTMMGNAGIDYRQDSIGVIVLESPSSGQGAIC
jgi:hypothetical protein